MQNVNEIAGQPALMPVFNVGGTDIDLVNKVKYLGLLIDNSLTWRYHIENIKGKVSHAIGLLKYCKNFVSMETLKGIYRSIVEPQLNYCCSVWGCNNYKTGLLESLGVVFMMHLLCRYAKKLAGCPSKK